MQKRWSLSKLAQAMGMSLALLTGGIVGEVREVGADGGHGDFHRLRVIGLTSDGRLVSFKSGNPHRTRVIGAVTGLTGADTALIGIDFRVQDGLLYGVGNGGGVYTIDTSTAVATPGVGLTVALDPAATSFGVDFNPAADRLRIISNTGQNLRHNVNAAGTTATDGVLTYTAPPAAPVAALGVTAAAYTNNDLAPSTTNTATTLFDIDTTLDQVAIQSPANNGILVATGKLGVDADVVAGFDIYSEVDDGVTERNRGFAVLIVGGTPGFYRISLLTGRANKIDDFDDTVTDIALPLNQ